MSFDLSASFTTRLLEWFAAAGRPLPWREACDPYSVWVSEIMLQQTQAERGVRFFKTWMRRFPDIRSVAEAGEEEVVAAWEGLGYYSRARNLHRAARRIMEIHGGRFPSDVAAIRSLPGVGEYTAGAVAAIAFNQPEPAVDANVKRVFSRVLDLNRPPEEPDMKERIRAAIRTLIPDKSPGLFNQALMELGALVCAPKPKCGRCPVAEHCAARRQGTANDRPVQKKRAGRTTLVTVAAVIIRGDGAALLQQRPPAGLWAGFWEFPGGPIIAGEEPARAAERLAREQTGLTVNAGEKIVTVRHGYTAYSATMHGFFCAMADGGEPPARPARGLWLSPEELTGRPFPAGQRKILEHLGWKNPERL